MTKADLDRIEAIARKKSTEMALELTEWVNEHHEDEAGTVAGTTASMMLQTILVSLMLSNFTPGSQEGLDWLSHTYNEALRDVLARWQKPDLKAMQPGSTLN